ncbi:FAD-dependent oxidoreductase [Gluconacetobacter johannae]|uniref:D-amino-acid oxidase n=1 Tax=Gluconacetobacter johannae TaxID=112140 RepID=A0A7W4P4A5_9PROT|nr:FAD-dependent oxidoreductase [Gluconacetobacter johannae]MBB2176714.1 FAD-binding oxidoreductase [Gluconacetobacter johannae]
MRRRQIFAGGIALGALGAPAVRALVGPAGAVTGVAGVSDTGPGSRLAPFRPRADQITAIKVCLRPFRAAGPRLDVEHVAGKTVIHNYGHGGSGWSLSWGSANIAVGKAAAMPDRRIAVIGCGIIGLTSALTALRAGFDVTIYARDLLPHTRSVRANGSWTPDSRIALTAQAGPAFADLWEQMARYSWATYRDYLGLPGNPIEFVDSYVMADAPPEQEQGPDLAKPTYTTTGRPQQSAEFAQYGARIRDIIPAETALADGTNPFGVAWARHAPLMIYNFGAYGHLLLEEFHQAGGRMVVREFHTPADLGALPEKTVINCPGYAARDWWNDDSVIPVRGQTAWLPPDPTLHYGLDYRGAAMIAKSDGVMIQGYDLDRLGEMAGVGNSFEHPDRAEAERAVGVFADLFSRSQAWRG